MKRREFITLIGGAATAWPLAARAQRGGRVPRVGFLYPGVETLGLARTAALREGLRAAGYREPDQVELITRVTGGDPRRVGPMATELIESNVDVLVPLSPAALQAVRSLTSTIPIVAFDFETDPIGSGLVKSLARPGGNVTGLLMYEEGITGKWLAMLKEIAPGLSRAALITNPRRTPYDYFVRSAKSVAPSLAIELAPSPVENAADIERVIESFAREPNGGLVVLPGTPIEYRDLVIALAARHRLPAVYIFRSFVMAGGLMSYGIDLIDQCRQAASYVDRILRGAKATDLPVQAPTKYETVLNLKTAKALGLEVPPSLLVRADEVIE